MDAHGPENFVFGTEESSYLIGQYVRDKDGGCQPADDAIDRPVEKPGKSPHQRLEELWRGTLPRNPKSTCRWKAVRAWH